MKIHRALYLHISYVLLLLTSHGLFAQDLPEEDLLEAPPLVFEAEEEEDPFYGYIALSGKKIGNHVRLRWAPSKSAAWYYAKDSGYYITRIPVRNGILDTSQAIILNKQPVKPWPIEDFEAKYQAGELDTMSLLIAQMTHGNTDLKSLSPIERSDMLRMRFSYSALCADLSPQAADAAGLGYTDTIPGSDSAYVYQIFSPMDTSLFILDPGAYYHTTFQNDTGIDPLIHKVISNDMSVRIEWLRNLHEPFFTAYYIERSLATEEDWTRLNSFPFLPILDDQSAYNMALEVIAYKDSLPENDVLYKYRLIGITPFGELSEPSKEVVGVGVAAHKPPPPTHVSVHEETAGELTVKWQLPHEIYPDEVDPGDLLGFLVARSGEPEGPFTFLGNELIPPDSRQFIDKSPFPFVHNYYIVYSMNTVGKYTISLPGNGSILDTIPPAMPLGLEGTMDSTGLVTLEWKLGKEVDLRGYYVYFEHKEDGIYNRLTSYALQDTRYEHKVSLNTLSREVYYKIAAVDLVGNVSEHTEALLLLKPDIYPPVAPQITDIKLEGDNIKLEWASSSSMDVAYHLMERKASYESDWKTIDTITIWEPYNAYVDDDTKPGHWYDYKFTAIDASNLRSEPSDTRSLRTPWKQEVLAVPSLEAYLASKNNKIILSWNLETEDIQYFSIYRVNEHGTLNKIDRIPGDRRKYEDTVFGGSNYYDYTIRANIGGKMSGFSNEKRVTIREVDEE
jgi:uncharacterized protein